MPNRLQARAEQLAVLFASNTAELDPRGLHVLASLLRGETPRYVQVSREEGRFGTETRLVAVAWTTIAWVDVRGDDTGRAIVTGASRPLAAVVEVRPQVTFEPGRSTPAMSWTLMFADGRGLALQLDEGETPKLPAVLDVVDAVVQKWDHADDPAA